jgi:hypothetical protein
LDEASPFVEWVKEGRKYDLGGILITQQPGSMAPELLSQADNWFCFHLLSEGDAGTLGKYNSHYSDDVLAHLIGEPIRGNCYMWSAPHQPFVLPVRIRSFEDLYRTNIENSPDALTIPGTLTSKIVELVGGAQARLSQALLAKLKGSGVRYVRVPNALPGGKEGVGVASGQLFYLIKEIKDTSDTTQEDELKKLLLTTLLGEGALHVARHPTNSKDYYCAKLDDWTRLLGTGPVVHDA